MKHLFYFFLLFSLSVTSQIKGVVKDSLSGQPIPYVNIWVENENTGATSEENGEFSIHTSERSKNLVFSALGYEKKKVKISEATNVKLKAITFELNEVVISKRRETRQIEIGKTQNETYQAFDNGPRTDLKFFPFKPSYKRTKYIRQVSIYTDSTIESATIRFHFYGVDAYGMPGEELLTKDFVVSVRKGMKKSSFDVRDFNLIMPKTGIFVGFEKLLIERNKTEKTITDFNSNTTRVQKTYYPFVLYNYVDNKFSYVFSNGKWNRKTEQNNSEATNTPMAYEPALYLTLTN